jgi:hypothetical protein
LLFHPGVELLMVRRTMEGSVWFAIDHLPQNTPSLRSHFFVLLDGHHPNVLVSKRSFRPLLRYSGTGDAEFDRRFLVRADDRRAALAQLTPTIRRAALDGSLPPVWSIKNNVLKFTYSSAPAPEELGYPFECILSLANALG